MEIATTMSPSNKPQSFTEITAADEAGGTQAKGVQSPSFGLLFDQWAGTAGGERLPADSGNNNFFQSPLREELPAELATDDALRNDPHQEPLLRVTDTFTAGMFKMAVAAPDKTVQQQPEQTAADSGVSEAEKGVNSAAVPTPGEREVAGTSTLQMHPGLPQNIVKSGDTGEITTDLFGEMRPEGVHKMQIPPETPAALNTTGGLPVLAKARDHSAESPPGDKPHETGDERGGTDSVWTPQLVMGNLLSAGNFVTSLPESAGPLQKQGITQPANKADHSVMQPDDLLQAAAGGANVYFSQVAATPLAAKAPDFLPVSGVPSGASVLKESELYHDNLPGIASPSGNLGRVTGIAMKTGGNAVIQQAKGDLQTDQKGMNNQAVDISRPEADAPSRVALPASLIQTGTRSESAGNTCRAAATDNVLLGKNDFTSITDSVTQGIPPANQEPSVANTGMGLSRMEIVFTAAGLENLKETGSDVTRKSGEGNSAENVPTPALVTNPAELRTPGESSITTPSPDANNPLGEHITNQIREKLAAGGLGSDNSQITLKLHPEELGELKINIRMEDQHLKVEITTQNLSVKNALMQNLDTLKETLSRQNIAMDRFDVSAELRQGSQQGGRDGRQMTQNNRATNTGFQQAEAIEEDTTANLQYSWENENSLVNLVL